MPTTKPTSCAKCNAPLEQTDGHRPKRYCGSRCRRASELEITRLQRHLERMELRRNESRVNNAQYARPMDSHRRMDEMAGQEIAAAEARLLALMDEEE